jgi:twitching motility two-component system response regulator PilG
MAMIVAHQRCRLARDEDQNSAQLQGRGLMSETLASHTEWIQHAIAAAKAGNPSVAKIQLQKAAEEAPGDPAIWLWMGWLADSPASAAHCLELARSDERFEKVAVAGIEFAKALADFQLEPQPEAVAEECEDTSTEVAEQNSPQLDPVEAVEEVVAAVESLQQEDVLESAVNENEEPPAEIVAKKVSVESTPETAPACDGSEPVSDNVPPEPPADSVQHEAQDESNAPVSEGVEEFKEQPSMAMSGDDVEAALMQSANELWQVADDTTNSQASDDSPKSDSKSAVPVSKEVADEPRADQQLWQPESEEVVLAPVTIESEQVAEEPTVSTVEKLPELIADEAEDDFSFATDDDAEFGSAVSPGVQPSPIEGSTEHPQDVGDQWLGQQAAESPKAPVWRKAQSDWFSVDTPSETETNNLQSLAGPEDVSAVDATPFQQDSALTIEHQSSPDESLAVVNDAAIPTADATSQPVVPRVTASDVWQTAAIEKSALTAGSAAQVPAYQPMTVQPQARLNPESGALTEAVPQTPVVTSVPASNNIFAADASSDQSSGSGPANASSLDQKTVLVVDDSPTVRKLVSITLEKRGYKVVSAFDGVAAIKEIAAHNPSLILMDVNMPRLDGYQLCKLVKKHETTRDIPVLMLTGKDGMFDRLRGRLVGCAGSIAKPFSPEELLEVVEQNIVQTK